MRTFKMCFYEIMTGFALLGVLNVLFEDYRFAQSPEVMLVVLYLSIAVATEAVIVANLQPDMRQVISLNLFVTAILCVSRWTSDLSYNSVAGISIATLILRFAVARIASSADKAPVQRITAAIAGATLFLETLASIFFTTERIYYDYYVYPRIKDDYIVPAGWRNFIGDTIYLSVMILALYVSYRLLRYACRPKIAARAYLGQPTNLRTLS